MSKLSVPSMLEPSIPDELERVETALPAHLLFLMLEKVTEEKVYEFRPDILVKLNRAAIVPLSDLDPLTITRVAGRTDELARALIAGLSLDDSRLGLASSAFFILKLVDEGLFQDRTNLAVVVALLLIEDMRAEGSEWPNAEVACQLYASKMLRSARLLGCYLSEKTPTVQQVN